MPWCKVALLSLLILHVDVKKLHFHMVASVAKRETRLCTNSETSQASSLDAVQSFCAVHLATFSPLRKGLPEAESLGP